ncbi:RraA family protein [Brucella haematophila]|jgi:4-hydroxy-4-methyl-2-oxoglutarate aldolase|uniref:Putative 4-hydroxy-4-methyl-2-oxoglutarate aldolase n=1 Tax=Brucella haematophila TaxID=419474 RepID=A0ABX1DTA4_9HYPH|nr:RraA family protein [Brucella haematophila]MBA8839900.1 4-hydroxy-4-methyl-2-oxoglutarate aldolase [Ochrobactrum sp. RH2CCR150]NKC04792.1 RraA family protein [Brucella haematophila]TMV02053.1 RraA family protein [Brucella haematophila]
MSNFDYSDTDWASIERLSKWYSGDVHDSLEQLGGWGYLDGISLQGELKPGEVVCGPAVTVQFAPSERRNQPQDVYHNAIDNAPKGGIVVVDASCAQGSCSGELMSSGAKTRGAAATIVNGTVRDIAQVRHLGYPLFGRARSPVSVSGKMEPKLSQVPIEIAGVKIMPGDVVFADIDGVVVIPKAMVAAVADQADKLGANEASARDRILGGEKLQSVWPVESKYGA